MIHHLASLLIIAKKPPYHLHHYLGLQVNQTTSITSFGNRNHPTTLHLSILALLSRLSIPWPPLQVNLATTPTKIRKGRKDLQAVLKPRVKEEEFLIRLLKFSEPF
nr:hypothetical protein [Tanacetum cinerariifolium]